MLNVNFGSEAYTYNHINTNGDQSAIIRGRAMALMQVGNRSVPFKSLDPKTFNSFAKTQQVILVNYSLYIHYIVKYIYTLLSNCYNPCSNDIWLMLSSSAFFRVNGL